MNPSPAYETRTSGRTIHFVALPRPALTFAAVDADTGELLGRVSVWDANPELAGTRRMLDTDAWTLDSPIEAELGIYDQHGRFERGVNGITGTLAQAFDAFASYCRKEPQ